MKVLLIDNNTRRIDHLKQMLMSFDVKIVSFKDIKPKIENNFDLIVLSGGHGARSNTKLKVFEKELELIRSTNKPIFGICKGMQLIA